MKKLFTLLCMALAFIVTAPSYAEAQKRVEEAYRDTKGWARSAMLNTACSGKFTSDRTIEEYVHDIWHLEKVEVPSGQDLFE